jgi:putative ABC transport system permease protein
MLSSMATVTFEGETTRTQVAAVTAGYDSLRSLSVTEGQFISDENILGRAAVAVLGPDTATNLFGRSEGVTGETIRVDGQPFRVIGVIKARAVPGSRMRMTRSSFSDHAQARLVRKTTRNAVDMILVQAATAQDVPVANEQVAEVLRSRHRTPVGADDFTIFTQQSFLDIAKTITGVLTIFLGGIAGISLLVGGIGIMNIMLVSVTERRGDRAAQRPSARRRYPDPFLTIRPAPAWREAHRNRVRLRLSFLVGVIARASNADLSPTVSLDAILLATLFSAAVEAFFRLYPPAPPTWSRWALRYSSDTPRDR